MKKQEIKAFTLVELIIVITILAILATIGFMSYQSYTADARDWKRKRDLWEVRSGLEIYQMKNSVLPDPDAQTVIIMSGANTISTQWYLWANVLQKLRASGDIKDYLDNNYYTYSVNWTKTKYQLLGMFENSSNLAMNNNLLDRAYAQTDYTNRYAYTIWNKVWIFFSWTTNNTPIQETMSWNLDLTSWANATKIFKVMFSNQTTNSGTLSITWANLPSIIQTETNSTTTTTATNPWIKTTWFSTTLYTWSGGNQSITTWVDMSSQWWTDPSQTFWGLVWGKSRSNAQNHYLTDTINGAGYIVQSSTTNNQLNNTSYITNFTNNGFSLALNWGDSNYSWYTYASWNFQTTNRITGTTNHSKTYTCQYNPYTWFTMVKYVGSGLAWHEIPNCLGKKLNFVLIKSTSNVADWWTFTDTSAMVLNTTAASPNAAGISAVSNTASSSILNQNYGQYNQNNATYILYGWTNSYYDASNNLVGNYEIWTYNWTWTSGNKITTKAKPAWIMVKSINSIDNWYIFDNKRLNDWYVISPNLSNAEDTSYDYLNFNSDGFTFNASYINQSSSQYLYMVVYDNDNWSGKSTYMLK